MSNLKIEDTEVNIIISEEVVAGIAANAAKEIEGVTGISTKITGADLKGILGGKSIAKGVKVEIKENDVSITILLNVKYGTKIPEIAAQVQENVKNAVVSMTGLNVLAVNINVIGVAINKEIKSKD